MAAPGPLGDGLRESWLTALWSPDPATVRRLLEAGVSANATLDERDTRPLHVLFYGPACRSADHAADLLTATDLLIDAGAEVNAADGRGSTPLMMAAAQCPAPVVSRLLAAGADPGLRNQLGLTAFEMTLATQAEGGRVIAESGFRLDAETLARYRGIFHDEPPVLAHLALADPGSD